MGTEIRFGIVGSGWRSECFLRTASLLGPGVKAVGVVSRSGEKRAALAAAWDIPCFSSAPALLDFAKVDFLLVSVPGDVVAGVLSGLMPLGIPLLCETPPASSVEGLVALNEAAWKAGARVQVAEQYWLHPMHSARIRAISSGLIGEPAYAHVSVNHGYHNISLIRKFLGLGFEEVEIVASSFPSQLVGGPGRSGDPACEELVERAHDLAFLDFGAKQAFFDFEADQHRSWIRSSHVLVRGDRGEIDGERIVYLKDFLTPVRMGFRRVETGGEDDFEGCHLKGVMLGEDWLFRNPTAPARLSDEEIGQARLLYGMKVYAETGEDVYSLAQASQDAYIACLLKEAIRTGNRVRAVRREWAR